MSNSLGNNGGRFYSSLVKPTIMDCQFTVDPTNGLGITGLKGSAVRNVFMHTSTTPTTNQGYLNPNPANGMIIVQFKNNFPKVIGALATVSPPLTGSNLAINSTALTIGQPYTITAVGTPAKGAVTIAPVADVSGSLASTWFRLFDAYGNTFVIWFSVSGVGTAPSGVSGTLVQQTITSGATAATIGAALVTTIAALPSGISGVFSFTAAGTTTVTVTNTAFGPFAGVPSDGVIPTGFTFAQTIFSTSLQDWQGVGLPKGIIPAVGATFIATATGYTTGGASTGTVKAIGVSGISNVELLNDPNLTLSPVPQGGSRNSGGWAMFQMVGATSSSVTTLIPVAPTALTIINLALYLECSSVVISGE